MKRKVRFIAALFCMGCLATEPAADIKAAGIQVAAAQTTLSADNSLEVLSLSAGTLSPDFTGKTVQYTATVPSDVTSVTVTATPVNEFATVQSITGNDNLQVGTNTIKVVVKAQNGALAQYTITLTREDGQAAGQTTEGMDGQTADGSDGQPADQAADGTSEQPADGQQADQADDGTAEQPTGGTDSDGDTSNMEYLQQEYNELSEQYAKERSFSRNVMGIMAFVIAVLVVIVLNLLLRGRKNDEWEDDEDDWDWKTDEDRKNQRDTGEDEDTGMEVEIKIQEDTGVEDEDGEEDDWEEKEPQRKGFFRRKSKEKEEEEPDDGENILENEVGVSKIHKVRAGLFGQGSDDLDDEDWEDEDEFSPVERKKPVERQHPEKKEKPVERQHPEKKEKPVERQHPEKKEKPEEKQRPEKKEKTEEKQRTEKKERPEKKHTPERKHTPREEEEDDDLEIIDLNDL